MKKTPIILGVVAGLLVAYGIYAYVTRPTYALPAGERPFKGRADAAVVVNEFSDFQCPACKTAVPVVEALDEKYGANIRINYRHFPLRIHPFAKDAALAAECANDQGKFWEMHDLMFANQPNIQKPQLKKMAEQLGLKTAEFNACLDSKARQSIIDADVAEGNRLGLGGTPTFYINDVGVGTSGLEAAVRKSLGLQ